MRARRMAATCAAMGVLLFGRAATGLIKVDMPMTKVYETAKAVVVGKVTQVNADNRVLDVKVVETLKGDSPGETLRIQIVAPVELIKAVSADQPVVVVVGKAKGGGMALVHLADAWLLAELVPNSNPQAWRVIQPHADKAAFPGRTAALVQLLAELKAGKCSLLNEAENKVFKPDIRELAKLSVAKPAWMLALDANGDKKLDLLIGTANGTRLLLATDKGYQDVTETWGGWGAAGGYHAVGDVNGDGRPDLLLDGQLWINDGAKFAPGAKLTPPEKGRPLAAALVDVNGDKRADAVLLSDAGELRVFLNPGSLEAPWTVQPARALWKDADCAWAAIGDFGDNGKPCALAVGSGGVTRHSLDGAEPPADFERLTGLKLAAANKALAGGIKNVAATVLDVNGDRRPDLLFLADGGGLLLVNRGFGAYMANPDAPTALLASSEHAVPFKLTPTAAWCAADLHATGHRDLLVLTDDGRLFAVDNAGPPGGTPSSGK